MSTKETAGSTSAKLPVQPPVATTADEFAFVGGAFPGGSFPIQSQR